MHAYTLVLVGLQSASVGADNGCQFSRRRGGEPAAVEFRMPVWFFLLLPLASANQHKQDEGHQDDPDRHQDHQLTAPKVQILMLIKR